MLQMLQEPQKQVEQKLSFVQKLEVILLVYEVVVLEV